MRLTAALFLMIASATAAVAQQPAAAKPAYPAWLKACEIPTGEDKPAKALCGSYAVFEDRAARTGRKIELNIVVFPATGSAKLPDPVFYFAGGPGSAAAEEAPYIAEDLTPLRTERDLVFVDQRGTGRSNPLNCTFFNPSEPQSYLGHWNPLDDVRRCRTELEKNADLRLYTTSIAMDDLDEVRAALGYGKINLYGISYGTRAVQEYIRRHGRNVRSAVLHGVSLTGQHMPGNFGQANERALHGVLDECLNDAACRAAFPNIKADAAKVLETLRKGPVKVTIEVERGRRGEVSLSRDLAAEAIRYMLYQSAGASRVPIVLNTAAKGDLAPLAEAALFYRKNIVATGSNGMYLSVLCAEDLPFIDREASIRANEKTFLGNYRLVQQAEGCDLWPRGTVPKGYAEPVKSNVPVLIFSGQWDPVTPPDAGDIAAKNFRNSVHIVVKSGGHGFFGLDNISCLSSLLNEFIISPDPANFDTSCVTTIKRKGFNVPKKD
ncbi:MAG: alpha/beta hydrolase [Chloracidobacterium sp.]|nr:alpha/beta hydrolase [Chloracidobacterium sp.]